MSSDYAESAASSMKSRFPASQYVAADCRVKCFRKQFDLVIEKGVIDAFVAAGSELHLYCSIRKL